MTRTAPPTNSSAQPASSSSSLTMESQNGPIDAQNQLIQRFSLDSGMNIEYSKLLVLVLILQYIHLQYFSIIAVYLKMNGITKKLLRNFKNYKNRFVFFVSYFYSINNSFFFDSEFDSS
jgi:hypothetical protein